MHYLIKLHFKTSKNRLISTIEKILKVSRTLQSKNVESLQITETKSLRWRFLRRVMYNNREIIEKPGTACRHVSWSPGCALPSLGPDFSALTKSRNYSVEFRDILSPGAVYICRVENITVTCAIKRRVIDTPFSRFFLPFIFIKFVEFMFGTAAAPLLNGRLIDVYTIRN